MPSINTFRPRKPPGAGACNKYNSCRDLLIMSVSSAVSSPRAEKQKKHKENKKKGYMRVLPGLLAQAENAKKKGQFEKAAGLYQKISAKARQAGEWGDAVKYSVLSAECSEREGRPFNAGWAYRIAALAAKEGGDDAKAAQYAALGAERFKESGGVYATKWCYEAAAGALKATGNPGDAIRFYEKSREVEEDDEAKNEIIRIKRSVSHPVVDQYAEKEEVPEGEAAKFEVVIENRGKETLRNITVGDRKGSVSHDVAHLGPGEMVIFSDEKTGKVGVMDSPYNHIKWQDDKGTALDFELTPVKVRVRPTLHIVPVVEPEAAAGAPCKFVLLVKNLSSIPLYDVTVDLTFGEDVRVPHPEPKTFGKVEPGGEYGASWGVLFLVPGRHMIADGKVTMRDAAGTVFKQKTGDIIITVRPKEARRRGPEEGGGAEGDAKGLKERYDDVRELMSAAERKYLQRKLDEDSFRKIMHEYGKEKAELELRLRKGGN